MQAKVALEKAGASGTPSLMTNMLKQSGLERQKLAPLRKAPMKKVFLAPTGPRNSMPPAAGFKKTANQAGPESQSTRPGLTFWPVSREAGRISYAKQLEAGHGPATDWSCHAAAERHSGR